MLEEKYDAANARIVVTFDTTRAYYARDDRFEEGAIIRLSSLRVESSDSSRNASRLSAVAGLPAEEAMDASPDALNVSGDSGSGRQISPSK
ncbi:MAG TPA: hypothetical protein VMO47_05155 [Rhodothermales bacterium]|nr:hypothetical protein [Rhodothermales bacterium]